MKDLREQALKLVTSFQSDIPARTLREMPPVFPDWLAQIESFAREIRNEALEEAAKECMADKYADRIRALKDPCILAVDASDESNGKG